MFMAEDRRALHKGEAPALGHVLPGAVWCDSRVLCDPWLVCSSSEPPEDLFCCMLWLALVGVCFVGLGPGADVSLPLALPSC